MRSSRSSQDSVTAVWICTQACLKSFRASCQPHGFQPRPWSSASQCSLDVMAENRATLRKVPRSQAKPRLPERSSVFVPLQHPFPGQQHLAHTQAAVQVMPAGSWLARCLSPGYSTLCTWPAKALCSCHIASDTQGYYRSARGHPCSSRL